MLCPEVWNFTPPKVFSSCKKFENLEPLVETLKINNFYKSVIITLPDELNIPTSIEEVVTTDSDYYTLSDCSLTEFVEPTFIEFFIKNGSLFCLSADTNCIIQNCACITPDGILTLHLLEFVFQTLGLEGTKRPHNYYEVNIDLKNLKNNDKVKQCLAKLESFNFHMSWEPHKKDICPSSLAKYFYDRNINVSLHTMHTKRLTPTITEIPSLKDTEPEEMVEWLGMLAHGADLSPKETYISSYCQPESYYALKSTRISVLIAKGFISPTVIGNICRTLSDHVSSREIENYWAAISVQSYEHCLWKCNASSPRMFQAHDSSCNVFLTHGGLTLYSVGQLKYS